MASSQSSPVSYSRPGSLKITRFEIQKAMTGSRQLVFLKIHTDAGLVGIGEGSLDASAETVEQALKNLERSYLGLDPMGMEEHWNRTYYRFRWRTGPVQLAAQSAIDIALWDLEGKRLGVPVWRLLGGALRQRLRVYYSHWASGITPRTPENVAKRAIESRKEGWTAVKINPARASSEIETAKAAAAEAAAIRKAVGDSLDICWDVAEAFSPRSSLLFLNEVAPYRPLFVEEPLIRELSGPLGEVNAKSSVPIATGEGLLSRYEFQPLFEARGASIIQPDVLHCGGITEMRKIAIVAEVHGVELAPHMWFGPIGHVASLHVSAVCRNFLIQEWDAVMDKQFVEVTGGKYPVQKDGYVSLPDGPGLGVDIDFEQLRKQLAWKS